jgi:REP element-mobilizing transposase RayT
MVRGIEGRDLFTDDADREDFLSRVKKSAADTGTRIVAWALMKSHVHFLLFSGKAGLAAFMRRLLTGYAIWFNRRHQRVGHLFQNRYKSIVCEEDLYLLELVRYIHLNPLRSSTVKNLEELSRYRWSGHAVLMGRVRNDWQETGSVLSLFGRERRKAVQAYARFLGEAKDMGRRPELVGGGLIRSLGGWSQVISLRLAGEKQEYDSRILGRGEFVEELLREADTRLARQMRSKSRGGTIQRVIKEGCNRARVQMGEIMGGSQRRAVTGARAEIAQRLNREMGIPMAEIARQLGVGTSAIAMAIRKKERADYL